MLRWKMVVVAAMVVGGAGSGSALGDVGPAWVCSPGSLAPVRVPAPAARTTSWLRFGGLKSRGPQLQRSEAGLTVSLGRSVAVQLHYERTAHSPMMREDHDDGVLTRLRLSF